MLMVNSVQFQKSEARSDAQRYLAHLLSKLKPGGRLIYHYDWLDAKRLSQEELVALFMQAGFRVADEVIPMPAHIPAETFVLAGGGGEADPIPLKRGFIQVFERPRSASPSSQGAL